MCDVVLLMLNARGISSAGKKLKTDRYSPITKYLLRREDKFVSGSMISIDIDRI